MADVTVPILPNTRMQVLTRIRRERTLPVRGQVTIALGSRVDPLDVVARTDAAGRLVPAPVARYLHVSEGALSKYLRKKPGEAVAARDIVASRPELFGTLQRVYRSPGAGYVSAVQGSWVSLVLTEKPVEVQALYRGAVVNVMANIGVVIEAVGTLVQGVWGGGGEAYGVLKKTVEAPGDVLTEEHIDVSARGAVLLAGSGVTEHAIERAVQEQAAGLIVGGLPARLRDRVAELGLPILVTEGFGNHPMAAPIFSLLSGHIGEETSVIAAPRGGLLRPEVFIPAPLTAAAGAKVVDALPEARVGAAVRILSAPRTGEFGKIKSVPARPQILESGVSAWGAEVELMTGESAFVPWENLELIG